MQNFNLVLATCQLTTSDLYDLFLHGYSVTGYGNGDVERGETDAAINFTLNYILNCWLD